MSEFVEPVAIAVAFVVWGYGVYCTRKARQYRKEGPRWRASPQIGWSDLTPLGRKWFLRGLSAAAAFVLIIAGLVFLG